MTCCSRGFSQTLRKCCPCPRGRERARNIALGPPPGLRNAFRMPPRATKPWGEDGGWVRIGEILRRRVA